MSGLLADWIRVSQPAGVGGLAGLFVRFCGVRKVALVAEKNVVINNLADIQLS